MKRSVLGAGDWRERRYRQVHHASHQGILVRQVVRRGGGGGVGHVALAPGGKFIAARFLTMPSDTGLRSRLVRSGNRLGRMSCMPLANLCLCDVVTSGKARRKRSGRTRKPRQTRRRLQRQSFRILLCMRCSVRSGGDGGGHVILSIGRYAAEREECRVVGWQWCSEDRWRAGFSALYMVEGEVSESLLHRSGGYGVSDRGVCLGCTRRVKDDLSDGAWSSRDRGGCIYLVQV